MNFIDPYGLTRLDVEVAINVIKQTKSNLRYPSKTVPYNWSDPPGTRTHGQYMAFGDYIRLNEDYYNNDLNDIEARELLDTLLHETLHANSSLFKQIRDSKHPHPDIEQEAARITDEILSRYLKERDPFYQHEKKCPK